MALSYNCRMKTPQDHLERLYEFYGRLVARKAVPFLIGSVLVAGILGIGFMFIQAEWDILYLFSPENGRTSKTQAVVRSCFPTNYSDFSPDRQTNAGNFAKVIVSAKESDNMLNCELARNVHTIHQAIVTMPVTVGERTLIYEDLCAKRSKTCVYPPLVGLMRRQCHGNAGTMNITFPIANYHENVSVFLGHQIGGIEYLPDGRTLKRASAFQLSYHLQPDEEGKAEEWEQAFTRKVLKLSTDNLTAVPLTSRTLETDIMDTSAVVVRRFALMFALVSIVCSISLSADWVRAKVLVGMASLFALALAFLSTFGLLLWFRFKFISPIGLISFPILALEAANRLHLAASWWRTDETAAVPARLGRTLRETGVPMTCTTIVLAVTYGVSSITDFPGLRTFFLFSALVTVFVLLCQCTFLAALFGLDGRRENANRHAYVVCKTVLPRSEAIDQPLIYKIFCAGGHSVKDTEPWQADKRSLAGILHKRIDTFLAMPIGKVLVGSFYLIYVGVAVWGCLNLQKDFNLRSVVADESVSASFYKSEERFFSTFGPPVSVIAVNGNEYWRHESLNGILDLKTDMEHSGYVYDINETDEGRFWLSEFLNFVRSAGVTTDNQDEFMTVLKSEFLVDKLHSLYISDVVVDNNTISCSRFVLQTKETYRFRDSATAAHEFQKIIQKYNVDAMVFHPSFFFNDMLTQIYTEAGRFFLALGGSLVGFVFLLTLSPIFALFSAVSCASICVGIIGFSTLWGVTLDINSFMSFSLGVSFSVEYSLRVLLLFVSVPNAGTKQTSMSITGPMSLQHFVATVCAVSVLSTSDTMLFRSYFKILFLTILFGFLHVLLLLPLCLSSICSKLPCTRAPRDKSTDEVSENVKSQDIVMTNPYVMQLF
ncbi:PREDICTED: patched domain-containing protein 3-like [Branchiostoma belcheri]|uniref:Patched domain-containing protein 3-like n=1 Tax=Branchiostoma belcheri TaxID=7741 RepID=A0A6P4XPW5_BRABE|nr:PREDICTED: patched domain-containing protein 3-like [Branchiostoma belcheri]